MTLYFIDFIDCARIDFIDCARVDFIDCTRVDFIDSFNFIDCAKNYLSSAPSCLVRLVMTFDTTASICLS